MRGHTKQHVGNSLKIGGSKLGSPFSCPNMQILTSEIPISQPALNAALEREIRTGFELMKANERRRELQAAEEARQLRSAKEIKGLGKRTFMMPHWEFFRLIQKYGHAEVHSRPFVKYLQKTFPHLADNKI